MVNDGQILKIEKKHFCWAFPLISVPPEFKWNSRWIFLLEAMCYMSCSVIAPLMPDPFFWKVLLVKHQQFKRNGLLGTITGKPGMTEQGLSVTELPALMCPRRESRFPLQPWVICVGLEPHSLSITSLGCCYNKLVGVAIQCWGFKFKSVDKAPWEIPHIS